MKFPSLVLLSCLLFSILSLTSGASYYVAPNGNDANDGSISAPYKTFQPALNRAMPGDTIFARGGTYSQANSMPITTDYISGRAFIGIWDTVRSGTASQLITVRNYPGEKPILDATGMDDIAVFIRHKSYWVIQGFEMIRGNVYLDKSTASQQHDIYILDNDIHNSDAQQEGWNVGMILIQLSDTPGQKGSNNIFIRNNKLHDYYRGSSNWQTMSDPWHVGAITVLSQTGYSTNIADSTGYIEFTNNTVYNVPQIMFYKNPSTGPMRIADNTFYNAQAMGFLMVSGLTFEHNLVYSVPMGFTPVGQEPGQDGAPGSVPFPASFLTANGQNAIVRYNTFVGMNSLFEINSGTGHTVNNNVFFGLSDSASGAGFDSTAYIKKRTYYGDPANVGNSIIQSIESNNNCFITPSADFQMVQRHANGNIEHYNRQQALSTFGFDPNSVFITSNSQTAVFENPSNVNYRLKGTYATQCAGMGYYAYSTGPDVTPPIMSSPNPSGQLPYGTTSATISISTNEPATCKFNQNSDVSYASMSNTFSSTGGFTHSSSVTVTNGASYAFFVRCADLASPPNVNTVGTQISFSVSGSAPSPPVISAVQNGTVTTSTAIITWTTNLNSNSTVRYGTNSGVYVSASGQNDNVQTHSVSLSSLSPTTIYYYVVISCNSNACSTSPQNTFTTTVSGGVPTPIVLLREDFENNQFSSRGWFDSTNGIISTSEHVSGSTGSFQCTYNSGATKCTGTATRHYFPETEIAYLNYWVKYSTNWVGSGLSYWPHEFHFLTTADAADQYIGPSSTHLTTYIEQNGGTPFLMVQDNLNLDPNCILETGTTSGSYTGCNGNPGSYVFTEQRSVSTCNGLMGLVDFIDCYQAAPWASYRGWRANGVYFQNSPGPYYKNDWHFVEVMFQMNNINNGIGVPDGKIRYWLDGQLLINSDNILLRTGANPNMKFNELLIAPYMGSSPITQTMWIDNLTVTNYRIGFNSSTPAIPVISNIQSAAITSSTATISWATDQNSNTTVRYGITSGNYPNSVGQNDNVLSHSVMLTGLTASTTYYYVVMSCNTAGCYTSPQNIFSTNTQSCNPTITVDSTYSGYNLSVIDDSIINANGAATTWASGESTTQPHFIEKEYCNPISLNNLTIWWAWNSGRNRYMTSQQVQVQYYSGSTWQTLATMVPSSNNEASSTIAFAQTSASRWRLNQPAGMGNLNYGSPGAIMWLTEIELSQTSIAGDSTPPAAITNLASNNLNPTSITLTWTSPGDDSTTGTATSYDLRYSNSQITAVNFNSASQVTAEPTPSIAGTSQSLTITGLTAQSTYYFAIKTLDEIPNTSPISNIILITTPAFPDTTNPSAISDLAATSSTAFTITLNWTAPGDDGNSGTATIYDLRYSTTTITNGNFDTAPPVSGEPAPTGYGTRQSMVISGLNPSTTYYFAIKAIDEVGNTAAISNLPNRATLAAPDTVAPSVTNPQPAGTLAAGTTQATISVATDEAATCRYSTTSNSQFTSMTQFTTTGALFHTGLITGLQNGQSYNYYVKCNDTSGNINGIDAATISFGIGVPPDVAPTVYLNAPTSGFQTFNTSITLNCSATDDNALTNLNLYTDITGTWQLTQSRLVSGTATTQLYTLNSLPTRNFKWNCLAIDSSGKNSTYATNFTFQVLPTIYNFTLTPTIDSMQIVPNSQQNSSITINNTGNQNLTLSCATSQSFATIYNCPSNLLVGQYVLIKAGINSQSLTTGLYPVMISVSSNTPSISRNSSLIVNVTSTPTYPIPVISQINASVTHQSAIISWLTDQNSNSSVNYGLTSGNLNTFSTINDNVQSHSISLTSLTPATQYFFTVTSCNLGGCATSTIQTFNTTSTPVGCAYNNPPCQSGFSCQINLCVANYVPPVSGGSSGGASSSYTGPSTDINTKPLPSPSIKASVKPSATIPPSVQFVTIKSEIETSLPDLTIEGQDEIQQFLDEAERLQKTGNTQQALVLLNRAKTRLNDLKTKKADYPWQLGLIGLTILIGVGIYYFKLNANKK